MSRHPPTIRRPLRSTRPARAPSALTMCPLPCTRRECARRFRRRLTTKRNEGPSTSDERIADLARLGIGLPAWLILPRWPDIARRSRGAGALIAATGCDVAGLLPLARQSGSASCATKAAAYGRRAHGRPGTPPCRRTPPRSRHAPRSASPPAEAAAPATSPGPCQSSVETRP